VVAEPEEPNVLYPGCDCSWEVGQVNGRGDCIKNWCYVDSTSPCQDKKDSKNHPGLKWSKKACLGRIRPTGCDCNGKLSNGSRGECRKNWCYVNHDSTCGDTRPSKQVEGWFLSYEACRAPPVPPQPAIWLENGGGVLQ